MREGDAISGRLGIGSRAGLGLLALAPIIEDDNKTKEEIEAEERARLAASNFGAIIGLGIAATLNISEQNEEEINENEEDDDFVQNM